MNKQYAAIMILVMSICGDLTGCHSTTETGTVAPEALISGDTMKHMPSAENMKLEMRMQIILPSVPQAVSSLEMERLNPVVSSQLHTDIFYAHSAGLDGWYEINLPRQNVMNGVRDAPAEQAVFYIVDSDLHIINKDNFISANILLNAFVEAILNCDGIDERESLINAMARTLQIIHENHVTDLFMIDDDAYMPSFDITEHGWNVRYYKYINNGMSRPHLCSVDISKIGDNYTVLESDCE